MEAIYKQKNGFLLNKLKVSKGGYEFESGYIKSFETSIINKLFAYTYFWDMQFHPNNIVFELNFVK